MESKIEQIKCNQNNEWKNQLLSEMLNVRTSCSGSEFNKEFPIISVEHFFPEIQDPMIIKAAYNEFRHEWDDLEEI